jgi:hypothetical protein
MVKFSIVKQMKTGGYFMNNKNFQVEKLCGFYVSDWHLTTTILPYINSKIDEKTKVITILENNIEENIKVLMKKLNLKNKNEILSIRWTSVDSKKYTDIENILNTEITKNAENIILISGNKNYIEIINNNINKWLEKANIKSIKIIDFFEVTEFNNNIVNILDGHDKILNTSGEREISEVFDGYQDFKNVANNN